MNDTVIKSGADAIKVLGWCVWGLSCLLLLWSLAGLRKEKGRSRRVVFCVFMAAGLVVTLLTPLSKFHLLWIILGRVIFALIFLGLMIPAALVVSKIKQRKPELKTLPALSHPPFGKLEWTEYDWWEGEIRLPAWAGFQSRGGAYGSQDSNGPSDGSATISVRPAEKTESLVPSEAQCRAVAFQIEHGDEVVQSVLTALLPYYRQMKQEWEADDELMPPVSSAEELRKSIGLSQVHVHPYLRDGLAYVGLEFGCDWEPEHGLGVMLHGARVVDVGAADSAFDIRPDEAQDA